MIPFKGFNGYLKRLDINNLSEEQKSIFAFAFSGFFFEETINTKALNQSNYKRTLTELEEFSINAGPEKPFNYRRFSGGDYLERGRYYTLCNDSSGDDYNNLVAELLAYSKPSQAGEIVLLDLDSKRESSLRAREFYKNNYGLDNPQNTILMQCNSEHGIISPIQKLIKNPNYIKNSKNFPIFLKTEVIESTISNVIDLRYPDVQKWMFDSLSNGIENLMYMSSDRVSQSPFQPGFITEEWIKLIENQTDQVSVVYPPNENWDGVEPHYSDDLVALLSILMHPHNLGGTPLTNAIGRWLQSIGANALIYPSARTNIKCEIKNGEIIDHAGFILVDYQNIDKIPSHLIVINEPSSWMFMHGKYERVVGKRENAGSWMTTGIVESMLQIKALELKMFYESKMK